MSVAIPLPDDFPTRFIEAEEKAAVFIVKYHGARSHINKVMQEAGFLMAEESRDRKFQCKVNRRVDFCQPAEVPTALGWVVTQLHKEVKAVKPFVTENLIEYVYKKTSAWYKDFVVKESDSQTSKSPCPHQILLYLQ